MSCLLPPMAAQRVRDGLVRWCGPTFPDHSVPRGHLAPICLLEERRGFPRRPALSTAEGPEPLPAPLHVVEGGLDKYQVEAHDEAHEAYVAPDISGQVGTKPPRNLVLDMPRWMTARCDVLGLSGGHHASRHVSHRASRKDALVPGLHSNAAIPGCDRRELRRTVE